MKKIGRYITSRPLSSSLLKSVAQIRLPNPIECWPVNRIAKITILSTYIFLHKQSNDQTLFQENKPYTADPNTHNLGGTYSICTIQYSIGGLD